MKPSCCLRRDRDDADEDDEGELLELLVLELELLVLSLLDDACLSTLLSPLDVDTHTFSSCSSPSSFPLPLGTTYLTLASSILAFCGGGGGGGSEDSDGGGGGRCDNDDDEFLPCGFFLLLPTTVHTSIQGIFSSSLNYDLLTSMFETRVTSSSGRLALRRCRKQSSAIPARQSAVTPRMAPRAIRPAALSSAR